MFLSKNIYICPTCTLKNRLQLKYLKVVIHIVVLTGDSEHSSVGLTLLDKDLPWKNYVNDLKDIFMDQ
jgi:hypothetical protein